MEEQLLEKIRMIREIVQLDSYEHDNILFIDPYRINENENELFKKAKRKIILFFNEFFEAVKRKDRKAVEELGKHLHEINATKLGYTNIESAPSGRGFSRRDLLSIYDSAIKIDEHIEDMPDILMLAENVGPDKISDLTTNIIYEELLEFTKLIIEENGLSIPIVEAKKWIFNTSEKKWKHQKLKIPHIDNKEILFLPVGIAQKYEIFSYYSIYDKEIFPYLKANPAIHGLIRLLKDGTERSDCKKLRKAFPRTRATVLYYKKNFRNRYKEYKENMTKDFWRHN